MNSPKRSQALMRLHTLIERRIDQLNDPVLRLESPEKQLHIKQEILQWEPVLDMVRQQRQAALEHDHDSEIPADAEQSFVAAASELERVLATRPESSVTRDASFHQPGLLIESVRSAIAVLGPDILTPPPRRPPPPPSE